MISIESKDGRKSKPTALNTVEMLKVGSQNLGLGPSHVMQLAERLYIAGYISYPRTETSRYPESFDVQAAVQEQRKSDSWFVVLIRDLSLARSNGTEQGTHDSCRCRGWYAKELLEKGVKKSKSGEEHGDHPPMYVVNHKASVGGLVRRTDSLIERPLLGRLALRCEWHKKASSKAMSGGCTSTLRGTSSAQ